MGKKSNNKLTEIYSFKPSILCNDVEGRSNGVDIE